MPCRLAECYEPAHILMNILSRVGRLAVVAVLSAAPALVGLFLLTRLIGANVGDFQPAYDFDQYLYTREASTFAAAGFSGGYYGGNGHTARIGRFGPHGAAYAVVYGGLAKLCGGWQNWLAPTFNMVLLTLALLGSARGLSLGTFAFLSLCLTLFPPLVVLLPTAYQDAAQCALGLVLGGALAGLVRQGDTAVRRRFWLVLGLVLAATLTRPTWAVLFPAVFFCAGSGRWRDSWRALLWGGLCLAAGYGLFSLTAAPWTASPGTNPGSAVLSGGVLDRLPLFLNNLRNLTNFADNRYHTLVLLLMLSATGMAMIVTAGGKRARLCALAVHLCNMGAPLLAYVALYNGSGRHLSRLLAAHFVLSLTYAVKTLSPRSRTTVLAWTTAAGLALLPMTLTHQYALFVRPAYDDFRGFAPRIAAQAAAMNPTLSLSLGASSPWLRTLAVPAARPVVAYLAAPPAYGIELYDIPVLKQPLRAGFVLLPPAAAALASRHTPLTAVAETPAGTLYRNDVAFGFASYPEAAP